MGKKLAILFPGVGYSSERPLLYYARKVLQKNGFEVLGVSYGESKGEDVLNLLQEGRLSERLVKDQYLKYVSNAVELVKKQLEQIDFSEVDRLVFVGKSIGTVIGAVYAKQKKINPHYLMVTPIEYAFQLVEGEDVTVFCGTQDQYAHYSTVEKCCTDNAWMLHTFKACNHSLETGDVERDIEHMKRYVSIVGDYVSDLEQSIYDFDLRGQNQVVKSMADYKGKVLLIVNTATGCGYTPQYHVLEKLYRQYREQGLEILDFPCNQFEHQAPGSDAEIHSFCASRYDITFEQFSKINVNGEKQEPLYRFLKARKGFKGFDVDTPDGAFLARKLEKINPGYEHTNDIKWNFTKFLVDRKGKVIERYEPTADMIQLEADIQQLL